MDRAQEGQGNGAREAARWCVTPAVIQDNAVASAMQASVLFKWAGRALVTLLVAALLYAGLAALTLTVFASIFPPSGHPPLPDAPDGWYPAAFFVLCPLLALVLSLLVLRIVVSAVRRRRQRRA